MLYSQITAFDLGLAVGKDSRAAASATLARIPPEPPINAESASSNPGTEIKREANQISRTL
jgi:hypothetical protein